MKNWRTAALAAAFALAAALPALAAPVAGIVVALEGKPEIKAKGKNEFKRLRMNQMVYEGDTVKTKEGEKLSIAFIGGAEFRMNENSVFEVESGGGRQPTSLKTKVGQAWTRMLHGMSGVRVKTPMAVAAVRGTEADIDLDERLTVKVYEGHVDVSNAQGKQTLQAGQMTQVGAGDAPAPPKPLSPSDIGTWQDSIQPENVEDSLQKLNKEAERTKTLKLKDKDGKEFEIPLEKKQ